MTHLLWDASALIKRYALEIGSEYVDSLFESDYSFVTSSLGFAEVYASLRRKANYGTISQHSLNEARDSLRADWTRPPRFRLIDVAQVEVMSGLAYIDSYNLNASDAAILYAFTEYARMSKREECALVASDKRLIRAAESEGLRAINPESPTASLRLP